MQVYLVGDCLLQLDVSIPFLFLVACSHWTSMNKSHHRLIVPEMKEIEKDRDKEKEGRKGGEKAIPQYL